jgi:hypothetical protein
VPEAFYPSGVDVGGECILEGKKLPRIKRKTAFSVSGRRTERSGARIVAALESADREDLFRGRRTAGGAEGVRYRNNSSRRRFLRCDVEGAEVEVFRGAQRLLKEKRPGVICEMHSEENQRNGLEKFSRFGYACKPCGTNHLLALPQ